MLPDEGEKLVIATEVPAAPETPQTHQPTLLESAVAVPEPKVEEKPAAAEIKPEAAPAEPKPPVVEEKTQAEPKPKPTEEKVEAKTEEAQPEEVKPLVEKPDWAKIEFPETIKATPEEIKRLGETLDGILTPKEGETPLAAAKRLVDMHGEALQAYAKKVEQDQWKTWNDYNDDQKKQVLADPQIGGAGHQTAMRAIARVRDRLLSDAEPGTKAYEADAKEFDNFLRVTGAGNHKVFLKMLHRGARFVDEPAAPSFTPKPTLNNGVRGGARSLYSNTTKG